MQDGPEEVWSIPYLSVVFFPSLKQNFIAYLSSNVSSRPDCIFKFTSCGNQVLVGCIPIAAVAVYLNPESKIGQSSYKMYSNSEFSRVYDNFKSLYKKSLVTY